MAGTRQRSDAVSDGMPGHDANCEQADLAYTCLMPSIPKATSPSSAPVLPA